MMTVMKERETGLRDMRLRGSGLTEAGKVRQTRRKARQRKVKQSPGQVLPGRKNDAIACRRKFYESNRDAYFARKVHFQNLALFLQKVKSLTFGRAASSSSCLQAKCGLAAGKGTPYFEKVQWKLQFCLSSAK
jgi:hypothetical protein